MMHCIINGHKSGVSGKWQGLFDNASAHLPQVVWQFLVKHGVLQVRHPPYSPDLVPCYFILFPKLENPLKAKGFDMEMIECNAMEQLLGIPKN
jgi:histone-lysine N-methyltransferase SETMAR